MESLHIMEYLGSIEYAHWDLLGVLQHIAAKTGRIREADTIVETFKACLDDKSNDPNILKSAQNKARQLSQKLNISQLSQPDIVEFLENQAQDQEEHDPFYAVQKRGIGRSNQFLYKISEDFENFYKEDKFKDITIKVDNKVFKVHSSILYARSPYFREILSKNGNEISIPKITANSFEIMLKYIYSGMISLEDDGLDLFNLLITAIRLEQTEIVDYLKSETKLVLQQ